MTTTTRTAVVYGRVSLDRDGESRSVDDQIETMRATADRRRSVARLVLGRVVVAPSGHNRYVPVMARLAFPDLHMPPAPVV